jgi:hypothetical protein
MYPRLTRLGRDDRTILCAICTRARAQIYTTSEMYIYTYLSFRGLLL